MSVGVLALEPLASPAEPTAVRQTCYDCFRPLGHCYCEVVPHIQNRTRITILQHPRERFHPIGTARIARLALVNSELLVDHDRCFSDGRRPLNLPEGAGLLYPSAPSRALEDLTPNEYPRHLVVLDGTWHHARYMFRDVPGLADLPRYHLRSPRPSRYRLRKEPHQTFVSTIEAIAHCLMALEPNTTGVDEVLKAFELMIDRQIAARDSAQHKRPVARRRPKAWRSFPTAFAENFRNLVVVYGEAPEGQLVQWTAHRLSDGMTFEQFIRPTHPLDPYYVQQMGITSDALESASDLSTFKARWQHFARPGDVLSAWNQATVRPLARSLPGVGPSAYLKATYRGLARHGGALDQVVQAEGLHVPEVGCSGRAARRLGNAVALARLLGEMALGRDT